MAACGSSGAVGKRRSWPRRDQGRSAHRRVLNFLARNLDSLLATYGYLAVFVFVGVESIGIPIPGETMLVTAAVYAGTTHRLSIVWVIVAAAAGAIIGDNIGYLIGRTGGYRLLRRYGPYIRLEENRLRLGQYLFHKHGPKVVFFGRFISVLRIFAAFLAGVNRMHWRRFLIFNAAGGIIWSSIYGVAAYLLGQQVLRLSGQVDLALAIIGVAVIIAVIVLLRRNEARLQREADEAMPGPLEAPR
jgi:membrane protein DedA with SNARE-associated domain